MDTVDGAILFAEGHWPGFASLPLMPEEVLPPAAPAVATCMSGWSRHEILERGPLIHLDDSDQRWFSWRDWQAQRAPEARLIDPGVQVTNHHIAIHQTLMGQGVSLESNTGAKHRGRIAAPFP